MYQEASKSNPELISKETNDRMKQGEKITQDNIGFDSFDGIMLAKMAFSNPVPRGEFYKVFTAKSAGGLLIMIWAMLVMSLTALLGLLSYFIIGCIGGAAPLWIGSSAFTGNADPIWGWGNLFSRSVLISIIFDLAWLASVYVEKNASEFMDSNKIISCVIFTVALALAIWLWGKWVIKAVIDPVNLAGAEVRQKWGNFTEDMGKSVEKLGRRYGNEDLENLGGRMQVSGREHQSIAVEKREGRFDSTKGTEKDRLQRVRIEYDKSLIYKESLDSVVKDIEGAEAVEKGIAYPISSSGFSANRMQEILRENKLGDKAFVSGGELYVHEEHLESAAQSVLKAYNSEYIEDRELNGANGFQFRNMDEDRLKHAKDTLKENEIEYKDVFNLSVDREKFDRVSQSINAPRFMDNYSDPREAERDKTLLNKIAKQENGSYAYAGGDLKEFNDIRKTLESGRFGVKYSASNSIWVDDADREKYLDAAGVADVYDNEKKFKDSIQYTGFKFKSNDSANEILKLLSEKLPEDALAYPHARNRQVFVKGTYEDKAYGVIKDYVKELKQKIPYWTDGKYYYYKDSITRKEVRHLRPPENGRFINKV